MNTSVFENKGKLSSSIIFSTFLNFEAYYLSQFAKNSYFIADYLSKSFLLIDEADTILIDELINGIILAKPMNTNVEEVLSLIYDDYIHIKDLKATSVLSKLIGHFPEYRNITENEKEVFLFYINQIFKDIDSIINEKYMHNSNYIIEEKDNVQRLIPFDSEHKGIAEYNIEFGSFIHQLIGIKEKIDFSKKNQKLEILPRSMNYLFISHPLYVNKYLGVCGITGTIGGKNDKAILRKYYNLVPLKIPRNSMNLRRDLPIILCECIADRDEKICTEVTRLNEMNYPVLVVFNNINEIYRVKKILSKICKKDIYIFTGINTSNAESDKKDLEEKSGMPGAITLGTNFCGRGIDIKYDDPPLFVIVTYFNEDKRSINQVLGRSGRQGKKGITRIICTKLMFYKGMNVPDETEMKKILSKYEIESNAQTELISQICKYHNWIFTEEQFNKVLTTQDVERLRNYTININRITACKYKFPLFMNVDKFLEIQAQRIFSLKNCPECRQTWNLFRIYVRELIHESWAVFIDSIDMKYDRMIKNNYQLDLKNYSKVRQENLFSVFFDDQFDDFKCKINEYIPFREGMTITDLFLHIHDIVGRKWEKKILDNISQKVIAKRFVSAKNDSTTVFRIGFFPISVIKNSGMKISELTEKEQKFSDNENLYITDPELKYINKSDGKPFSITKVLDKIFDSFRELVDSKLKGIFGLRFFLRRTLAGCEFGIYVNPSCECTDYYPNCLIDNDPIILFTICTKSKFFWISGILIMVLIFATSLFTFVYKNFFEDKIITEAIVSKIKEIAVNILFGNDEDDDEELAAIPKAVNALLEKLIEKLQSKIIENMKVKDIGISYIAQAILGVFSPIFNLDFFNTLFTKMKLSEKVMKLINNSKMPAGKIIIISVLLIILIGQFILNFKHKLSVGFDSLTKKSASQFQNDQKNKNNDDVSTFNSYNKMKKSIDSEIDKDYS